ERPWLHGVRVYVLGPPRDIAALHNLTGNEATDMYFGNGALAAAAVRTAFTAAAAAGLPETDTPDQYAPFDRYLLWDETEWLKGEIHGANARSWKDLAKSYRDDAWRRIESDWLNLAAELALQLDNYTNNTSLVLAFELTATRQVLLFAGDAQIGNWLSWAGVTFTGVDEGTVTAADLLSRTVFYNEVHHVSHNAT